MDSDETQGQLNQIEDAVRVARGNSRPPAVGLLIAALALLSLTVYTLTYELALSWGVPHILWVVLAILGTVITSVSLAIPLQRYINRTRPCASALDRIASRMLSVFPFVWLIPIFGGHLTNSMDAVFAQGLAEMGLVFGTLVIGIGMIYRRPFTVVGGVLCCIALSWLRVPAMAVAGVSGTLCVGMTLAGLALLRKET